MSGRSLATLGDLAVAAGQGERKPRALANLGFHCDFGLQQLRHALHDTEAEPKPFAVSSRAHTDLIELTEDQRQFLAWDANAGIEDFEPHGCSCRNAAQRDRT